MNESGLPPTWRVISLDSISRIQLGKMLDAKRTEGELRRYLRNVNVRWGTIDLSDLLTMPFKEYELERYEIKDGDVLVCEGGEPGRAAIWSGGFTEIKYQKALHRVRLVDGIRPNWLTYQLQLDASRGSLSRAFSGSTIAHLPLERLKEYEVRVAPLAEQDRTLDALESHLSRLDAATASLERARAKLNAYRTSVLKAAVEGRLVPTEAELARAEKRDYEPASVLLKRILVERRRRWEESELEKLTAAGKSPKDDRWKAKYQEPTAPNTGDHPALPAGWAWTTLDQLLIVMRNGQSMPPREQRGVRTLRISAVRPLNIDFNDVRYLPGNRGQYEDDLVDVGDLLFTRYNGTRRLVGVCARVKYLAEPTVHPDKLIKVRLLLRELSAFVELAANAGESRRFIEARSRTTAGQTGISGGDLKQLPIPLPPLAEQARIVEALELQHSAADATLANLDRAARRAQRLRQSILTHAFEGRLVDQNPNDEPASQLLERIRSERSATPKTVPTRRGKRARARATAE